ncbi:MAG: hypothetical protein QOG46_965 [Pseudonocardiales bacterium]|jgi:hypothetical protein|nr:hypothetical protein [Pseudonocardiales bacterium]
MRLTRTRTGGGKRGHLLAAVRRARRPTRQRGTLLRTVEHLYPLPDSP